MDIITSAPRWPLHPPSSPREQSRGSQEQWSKESWCKDSVVNKNQVRNSVVKNSVISRNIVRKREGKKAVLKNTAVKVRKVYCCVLTANMLSWGSRCISYTYYVALLPLDKFVHHDKVYDLKSSHCKISNSWYHSYLLKW